MGQNIRQVVALALMLILIAPVASLAADGKKHFKQGLKYEENQQWDKAAEQFALAVAEKPSNVEFQLHLQRALVSAGIMLVKRGDSLAEQKDYNAAYQAYRQAYAYDPTNELALIKARRMLEAQGLPTNNLPTGGDPAGPKTKPADSGPNMKASYTPTAAVTGARNVPAQLPGIPGRHFTKTDVIYRDTPLLTAIENLAQTMKLNVIFDQQVINMMRAARLNVELRDVTYPRALEMLLKTNNLMYAQLDTRTIVIASDNPQSRMKFEPYSVRTFYVKNADIQDVRAAIQGTLQTKSITPVKQLNALIVRDTPSNLELIDSMIDSLDKSKAEVLVDVNIYEVSRNDLLQVGNQFNVPNGIKDALDLSFIGGLGVQNSVLGRGPRTLTGPFGFALGLPPSTISFFQDRGKAKLLASTQVHVIDGESNTVRIGQRVPIQTASLPTFGNVSDSSRNRANNQAGVADFTGGLNNAFGVGIPQIQYENVGLNIDVKPTVFEDEVQMTLKIESTSVDQSTGVLTPSFNQRTMNSVARVKDGQNTLVAGVSQNIESKGVRGMPIIGLIPILGRFFATPQTNNRQSDVVITVTPHILRRADIREEDHLARSAGDGTGPGNQLRIEQILYIAEQQEAEQNPIASGGAPAVAPPAENKSENKPVSQTNNAQQATIGPIPNSPGVVVQPVPTTAAPVVKPNIQRMTVDRPGAPADQNNQQNNQQPNQQSARSNRLDDDDDDDDDDEPANQQLSPLTVSAKAATAVATKGQDLYVAIILNGSNDISSAHISLSYDPNIIEAKSVRDSGLLRTGGSAADLQFTSEGGLLNIQMDKPQGTGGAPPRGQLCLIVFTVKNSGQSPLTINEAQSFFRTPSGQTLPLKVQSSAIEVR
jgi:general secretion pathway protein D